MSNTNAPNGQVLIYYDTNNQIQVNVVLKDDTIWLNLNQLTELFQTSKPNISMHIRNIFASNELVENAVVKDFLTTATDNKNYNVKYYNLKVVIALGYRINSQIATNFRIWATELLDTHLVNDARNNPNNVNIYFQTVAHQLNTIEAMETDLLKQVPMLLATAIDYVPDMSAMVKFSTLLQLRLRNPNDDIQPVLLTAYLKLVRDTIKLQYPLHTSDWIILLNCILQERGQTLITYTDMVIEEIIRGKIQLYNPGTN